MSQHFDQELDNTGKVYPEVGTDTIKTLKTLSKGKILKVITDNNDQINGYYSVLLNYERFFRNNNLITKEETESTITYYLKRLI